MFSSLSIYKHPKILLIFLLGMASGLPLPLTGNTLDAMLNQSGISKATIGAFALIGIPYTFKFLWSPLIDKINLPILGNIFGKRRSWMLFTQFILVLSIGFLGFSNPAENILLTACIAFIIAFASASQDIVIDAYRIEILQQASKSGSLQGAGSSATSTGYMIAMKLIGGAFAFWLSDVIAWPYTYLILAGFMVMAMLIVLFSKEPDISNESTAKNFADFIKDGVIAPFTDFIKTSGWFYIIIFIMCYKLGDAFAGKMVTPFLQDLGFTNTELAFYLKTFGLFATLIGSLIGGIIVYKFGTFVSLFIGGILQMLSNLMFLALAHAGHNEFVLALTIAAENLSGGLGGAAFVSYLSGLCNIRYTATQFALLTSLAAFGRSIFSALSGVVVVTFGWKWFFISSSLLAIPGIIILILLKKQGVISKN